MNTETQIKNQAYEVAASELLKVIEGLRRFNLNDDEAVKLYKELNRLYI